jgi:hypothetical protein
MSFKRVRLPNGMKGWYVVGERTRQEDLEWRQSMGCVGITSVSQRAADRQSHQEESYCEDQE